MWALLALYQALRRAMVTAVETVPGTDPDRASFTNALETAKQTLTAAEAWSPLTWASPAGSAAPSWANCSRPAARGSAPARSNPRCPAGTRPTRTGPSAAPR